MLNVIIVAIVCAALVSGFRLLRTRTRTGRQAAAIYAQIVDLARQPEHFRVAGAVDTMEGRFGVLVLHLFAVLERLARAGGEGAGLARATFEAFVTDMDDNMREVGLADTSVPRKVRRAAIAFYDRRAEYRAALLAGDHILLARSIATHLADDPAAPAGCAFASWLAHTMAALDRLDDTTVCKGNFAGAMALLTAEVR